MHFTLNTDTFHGLHWLENQDLGEAIERHKAEQICRADVPTLKTWKKQFDKDESGFPVIPVEYQLPIATYSINGELETQIQAYLDENGDDAIAEIVLDPETMTISIDEDVKSDRLAQDASEAKKVDLAATDGPMSRGVEDLVELLIAKGLITKVDIPQPLADKISARETLRSEISS